MGKDSIDSATGVIRLILKERDEQEEEDEKDERESRVTTIAAVYLQKESTRSTKFHDASV